MGTFLFGEMIFGPIHSRRLGASLGINLMPTNSKLCNFNCIYCECGWTPDRQPMNTKLPTRDEIKNRLNGKLAEMKVNGESLDAITFAGNGEPTIHPDFPGVIDDTIEARNKFFPEAKISVLSNSTTLDKLPVFSALAKIKYNILKLDSAIESTFKAINLPNIGISSSDVIENLIKFNGDVIVQTMFLKGEYEGQIIDNTTIEEVSAWLEALSKIKPKQVMIYSIARDTPAQGLEKIAKEKLEEIAAKVKDLGFDVTVS